MTCIFPHAELAELNEAQSDEEFVSSRFSDLTPLNATHFCGFCVKKIILSVANRKPYQDAP